MHDLASSLSRNARNELMTFLSFSAALFSVNIEPRPGTPRHVTFTPETPAETHLAMHHISQR